LPKAVQLLPSPTTSAASNDIVTFKTREPALATPSFDIYPPQASFNSPTTSDLSFVAAPLRRMDKKPATIFAPHTNSSKKFRIVKGKV
jgi:hypothetical protein